MEKQTLYRRYIKRYTLHQLLAELFGNNYHVEVRHRPAINKVIAFDRATLMQEIEDVYCLTIPRKLTEVTTTLL